MYLFYLFFLFINIINSISCQFLFELTRKIKQPTEDNFYNYLINNPIETEIKIGDPPQKIACTVSLNQHAFYILPIEKQGKYNYQLSKTFSNHTKIECLRPNQCLKEGFEGSESFIFKTINEEDKTIKDIKFIMAENPNTGACVKLLNAQIGLTYIKYSKLYDSNFISHLNNNKILKSYAFFFQFANNSDEKDYLIIGGYPHEYDSENYDNKNLIKGSVEDDNFWNIAMDVKINDELIGREIGCKIDILMKGIQCTSIYQKKINEMFFQEYLDNNLCFKHDSKGIYEDLFYYSCDLSINITKLPNLYFIFSSMNYTFNFTYNDLFIKFNNKYYFLIVFHQKYMREWVLGELFLKKYNIIFDQSSESISLYTYYISNKKKKNEKEQKGNEGNKSFLKTLVIVFFCSTIILSILLYKFLLKFPRKKRANELDDTFEYNTKEIVQKTDYSKLIN